MKKHSENSRFVGIKIMLVFCIIFKIYFSQVFRHGAEHHFNYSPGGGDIVLRHPLLRQYRERITRAF